MSNSAGTSYGTQLSGYGPYTVQYPPTWYYQNGNENFHSERGMPNLPAVESIQEMLSPAAQWPFSLEWGLHDLTTGGAQNGNHYRSVIDENYGSSNDLESFAKKAQFVNYESYKGIFEGPTLKHGNAMLLWMSQSAWPSMTWQTYDFYFDTSGAFYGCKKANQPVNAIFNSNGDRLHIVNNCGKNFSALTVEVEYFNQQGQRTNLQSAKVSLSNDQVIDDFVRFDTGSDQRGIFFIQTRVYNEEAQQSNERLISDNFYWMRTGGDNWQNFSNIQNVNVVASYTPLRQEPSEYGEGQNNFFTVVVNNTGESPALLIRLKVVRNDGKRVLPTYYQDNYFSLMPGQSKSVVVEFDDKYLDNQQYQFLVEGWNLSTREVTRG